MGAKTPYSALSRYYDLEYTFEKKEKLPEDDYFTYEFKLTNTGKGYIPWYSNIAFDGEDSRLRYLNPVHPKELFGHTPVFLPSEEIIIEYQSTEDNLNLSKGSFFVYAYEEVDGTLGYSGTNEITKTEDGIYVIDCEVLNMKDSYYSKYYFAVTLEYDGVDYCSICLLNDENKIRFGASEDFDVSKATVKKIEGFEEPQYHPNYAGFAIGGMLMILIPAAIILLIIAIITTVVLVLVFGLRKKDKKQ